jgi:hypothetical protein
MLEPDRTTTSRDIRTYCLFGTFMEIIRLCRIVRLDLVAL